MRKPKLSEECRRDGPLSLNACLEDEDGRVFLLALRAVADARGGMRVLSREADLNRESLYRMFSGYGNQ